MANKNNRYVNRRWNRLIAERGGKCQACEETLDLEFAHVKPTKCVGKGRGKSRRMLDVMKHPKRYILLCMGCHDSFDGRPRRKRQPEIRKSLTVLPFKECVNCGDMKELGGFEYCEDCNEELCADCLYDDHPCTDVQP